MRPVGLFDHGIVKSSPMTKMGHGGVLQNWILHRGEEGSRGRGAETWGFDESPSFPMSLIYSHQHNVTYSPSNRQKIIYR